MTLSEYTPLSPSVLYPRVGGSGLGAAVDVHSQVGLCDGTIAAGEVDESKEIAANTDDVEDAQPLQIMHDDRPFIALLPRGVSCRLLPPVQ